MKIADQTGAQLSQLPWTADDLHGDAAELSPDRLWQARRTNSATGFCHQGTIYDVQPNVLCYSSGCRGKLDMPQVEIVAAVANSIVNSPDFRRAA
jgi:hypothetical protein